MAKNLANYVVDDFGGGLNTTDNSLVIRDSELVVADNIKYIVRPNGKSEAQSIDGVSQQGNDIYVNGSICTIVLGAVTFNSKKYIMASNGTIARLMYYGTSAKSITAFADGGGGTVTVTSASHGFQDGYTIVITGTTNYNGTFTISSVTTNTFKITDTWVSDDATGTATSTQFVEANSQNFDASNKVFFAVYNSVLWFVNNTTTNSNVLHFLSTTNTLTGLTAAASGLSATMTGIVLHLERMWISDGNSLYVSKKYPLATAADWDASSAYVGADVPGIIQIDRNTEDSIQGMVVNFSQLVILRKYSLWLIAGSIITQSELTNRTNVRTGVSAKLSISKADRTIYIYTDEGVKTFDGITVKEGVTNYDTISTVTIDEPIKDYIDNFSNTDNIIGYAFRDKYYMSDASSVIFVYDELANGKLGAWSRWTETGADCFIEDGKELYCFSAEKYYKLDDSSTASLTSTIKTKDYDVGTPANWKRFHKILLTFSRLAATSTVTVYWHLDGITANSGSESILIQKATVQWDASYTWDQFGIRWDTGVINFLNKIKRWLKSGSTIAFTIEATGVNRFSLSRFVLDYELLKKEVT